MSRHCIHVVVVYCSTVVVVVVVSLFKHRITFTYSGLPVSHGFKIYYATLFLMKCNYHA